MNEPFAQRVRSAAVALWWTVIIGMVWLTAGWLIGMSILSGEPEWLRKLWGGQITWPEIHRIWITMLAVFKVILFVALLTAIWLSLWARGLKKASSQ